MFDHYVVCTNCSTYTHKECFLDYCSRKDDNCETCYVCRKKYKETVLSSLVSVDMRYRNFGNLTIPEAGMRRLVVPVYDFK